MKRGVRMRVKRKFIEPRMPFHHYQGLQALNVSLLKELQHSPAMFRHRQLVPKVSPALKRGSAAHCATLEPARYEMDYAIWDRKTDSGRAAPRNGKAWDEFLARAGDVEVLTEEEAIRASGIARAVRSDPVAARYLERGDPEVTMVWHQDKRPCKGRVDWLTEMDDGPVLVGLKTARDCRPYPFGAAAARLGYALQWYWYWHGYKAITRKSARMVEIVVDAEPPHCVVTYAIPDDVLEYGREECTRLLELLARCERDDCWPGPAETELMLSLPSWVYGTDEDVSDLGLEG